jgi:hypothetical protein
MLSACSLLAPETIEPQSLLTPYVTDTPVVQAVTVSPTVEVPTPTPSPTPTPFVHVLGSNETIYSVAYTYGIEVNEILAINPEVTPKALSIGTEILIPYIGDGEEGADELAVISEPLALEVSMPQCTQTADSGLWCTAVVKNTIDQSANGITLTFTLKDSAGEIVDEQTVPAVLNLLAPGDELPVVAYFPPAIPAGYDVSVALKTALPQEEAFSIYLPVNLKINSIEMDGRTASVSAVIEPTEETSTASSYWVALIAYDQKGQIAGVRRMEYPASQVGEEGLAFKAYVYSSSQDIQSVKVLAEAIIETTE